MRQNDPKTTSLMTSVTNNPHFPTKKFFFGCNLLDWPIHLILEQLDPWTFTNRPIFSVVVTLRVGAALGFSATEWTTQLCAQGMRNKAKTRPSNYLRPNHQRETSHEGNTQAKIRRDSAKVKSHQITMQKAARFISRGEDNVC